MKFDSIDEDDENAEIEDNYVSHDEEDEMDEFNEDEMNEENYRTTFEIESDPDEEAGELSDFAVDE